jgi:hypothetical protein
MESRKRRQIPGGKRVGTRSRVVRRARPLSEFLDDLAGRRSRISSSDLRKASSFFRAIGINSALTLYAAGVKGELKGYAGRAGLTPAALKKIVGEISKSISPELKKVVETEAAKPVVTGHIDWKDLRQKRFYESIGIKERKPLTQSEFAEIAWPHLPPCLIPHGPVKAVDLRPFLGEARDQQGRGTCGVFAGTVVAEAFECFRDRRAGPVDLAEEFVWWYRGAGQRYSAGGYDCGAAIDDIRDVGVCEEHVLPYNGFQINDNHTHVPIADVAIDRAQFYRAGDAVGLPWGDVDAVKRVLESGRCVCCAHNLDGWNTGTGEIAMPPAGTQLGGSHCTAIIGYIDRDDLPADQGGGYFIVRNSWGGAGSAANVLGSEYGGHLLMPYGWYRLYAGWPSTAADKNDADHRSQWLAEYYDNSELKGAPLETRSIHVGAGIFDWETQVTIPSTTGDVDFNWGAGSPVRFTLPLGLKVDALPVNNFSVRFSKVMRLREGWFRFHLRGDDGVRLYVDDRLVINQWKNQASTEFVAEHQVTGGDHVIRIEYYEASGSADVRFTMEPISWHYELFHNHTFRGAPAATFCDTLTRLEWRHAPPVTSGGRLAKGQFGLRGTARFHFRGGDYRFHNFSTGQLRVFLDGVRVADLAADGDFQQVAVAAGSHEVRIEFLNESTVPALGSHLYYKALCSFGWSDLTWNARFYKNDRCAYYADHWPELNSNPDRDYIFYRTNALAGRVRYEHDYPEAAPTDSSLRFNDWDAFRKDALGVVFADWPSDFALKYWGVWINRKIVIAADGLFNLKLDANEGSRLVVDGKEIVQNQAGIGSSPYNADVFLERGVHDVSIEYSPTQWGGRLVFEAQPAHWQVQYFANTNLLGSPSATLAVPVADVVPKAATVVGSTNYSARVSRSLFLPLGKYALKVRADDGVRLKVNKRLLIDAWYDQAASTYSATCEHQGGNVAVEIEYYQRGGQAVLEFSMHPTDFYGEYYYTRTLNVLAPGVNRPRVTPVAYRYEGDINFDWGSGSHLPRVGSRDFSARWRGKVHLPVGRWKVDASCDDGIRVFIGGRLLIDHWHTQPLTTHSRMIDLPGRDHDVMVEYFQQTGRGACRVRYFRVI